MSHNRDTSPGIITQTNGGSSNSPSRIDMLCMDSARGQPFYFGASSPLLFTRLVSSMLRGVRSQAPGLSMSGVDDELLSEMPQTAPAMLPDRFFNDLLVNAYFTHVHPQYPFLHQPTFMKAQKNVLDATENVIPPDPVELFFVYMVCGFCDNVSHSSSTKLTKIVKQVNAVGALVCPAYSTSPAEVRPESSLKVSPFRQFYSS